MPFRYQGQYEDSDIELSYNRFRYYDSTIGNYISQDPIGLEGSITLYNYVHDTNSWIDIFGLSGGTYIFKGKNKISGKTVYYVGKGNHEREKVSIKTRLGGNPATKEVHRDYGDDNNMGFMVEYKVMEDVGALNKDEYANAINSPGKKLYSDADEATREKVDKEADSIVKNLKETKTIIIIKNVKKMDKYRYNEMTGALEIDPFYLHEGLLYAKKNGYTSIHILQMNHFSKYGFQKSSEAKFHLDTDKLKEYVYIDELVLEDNIYLTHNDIENLYSLNKIKTLVFENKSMQIDLSKFPLIEKLVFKYNSAIKNINLLKHLKSLTIRCLNEKDCSFLQGLKSVERISLIRGSFTTLNGIDATLNIKDILIAYNPKLHDISLLSKLMAQNIEIEKCPNIKDYSSLKNCMAKTLIINSPINSISFIQNMPNIEAISFFDCQDGDMTPLLKNENLKRIWFYPNKKHYSHTLKQICEIKGISD